MGDPREWSRYVVRQSLHKPPLLDDSVEQDDCSRADSYHITNSTYNKVVYEFTGKSPPFL